MGAPFIGICLFVRCKMFILNAKGVGELVCWHWLGICSVWVLISLVTCRSGHLSAWLLVGLDTCWPGYSLALILVCMGIRWLGYSSARLLVGLVTCRSYSLMVIRFTLLVSLVTCRPEHLSVILFNGHMVHLHMLKLFSIKV